MKREFTYTKLPVFPTEDYPENHIYQPLLPITLGNQESGETYDYIALIDSGADICLFHGLIGELLGLDVFSGNTVSFGGVSGAVETAFVHRIGIQVDGLPRVITRAAFTYKLADPIKGILGHRDFFEYFQINFDYRERNFSLRTKDDHAKTLHPSHWSASA